MHFLIEIFRLSDYFVSYTIMAIQKKAVPDDFQAFQPPKEQIARLATLRPYIRQSGDQWRTPWFLKERKLLDYLMVYIAEGQGRFSVDGKGFDVEKGDLVWVPPDTLHEMCGLPPRMRCLYAHFDLVYDPQRSHWDMHVLGGTRDLSDFRPLMHPPVPDPDIAALTGRLRLANHIAVYELLKKITAEHLRAPFDSMALLSGLMLELVSEVLRGRAPRTAMNPFHWNRLQEAVMTIQDDPGKPLNVGAMARNTGLSEPHFRRLFREVHGYSPRTLRIFARIQKARELLTYSGLNISEIAFRLGFSTVHNFSRAFSRETGVSPSEFRQGRFARPRF
jgi:AraC-like DNA-binding protein